MLEKKLISDSKILKLMVGGITYRPFQIPSELIDIYGNYIDLDNLGPLPRDPYLDFPFEQEYETRYELSPVNTKTETEKETEDQYVIYVPESNSTDTSGTQDAPMNTEAISDNSGTNADINSTIDTTSPEISTNSAFDDLQMNIDAVSDSKTTKDENRKAWDFVYSKFGHLLGIKDQKAYCYLLGQLLFESGHFKYMEEIASGSAYEGRKDLGNIHPGDGKRFKGRGPVQVTGRSNYKKVYEEFFVPNGFGKYNIVEHPELGSNPYIGSLMTMGFFLTTKNGREAINAMNNYDVKLTTKKINGAYNGLTDRIKITQKVLKENGFI